MSDGRRLTIDGVEIHDGSACYVIAEIGHNHQGSLEQALQAVRTLPRNAARTPSSCRSATTARSTRARLRPAVRQREQLRRRPTASTARRSSSAATSTSSCRRYAREIGITFFATAFDFASADLLAELDMPAYKIASGDLRNTPLLRHVAAFGKPMILSTGGADDGGRPAGGRRDPADERRSSASSSAPPPIRRRPTSSTCA